MEEFDNVETPHPKTRIDSTLLFAWTAMFFASSFAIILWRELVILEPLWWPLIHVVVLVGLFVIAVASKKARTA